MKQSGWSLFVHICTLFLCSDLSWNCVAELRWASHCSGLVACVPSRASVHQELKLSCFVRNICVYLHAVINFLSHYAQLFFPPCMSVVTCLFFFLSYLFHFSPFRCCLHVRLQLSEPVGCPICQVVLATKVVPSSGYSVPRCRKHQCDGRRQQNFDYTPKSTAAGWILAEKQGSCS